METLLLTADDVRIIVRRVGLDAMMDALIDRLTEAFASYRAVDTEIPVRQGFSYARPAAGLLEWMPCLRHGNDVMIKVVGYHPTNPARRDLPTVLSTVSAYDAANGHLLCLMDGTLLTALRTGAASAIATRLLAAPESETVGLIGAGAQAVTQLHGLTRVMSVGRVLVHDADALVLATFSSRIDSFAGGLRVEPALTRTIVEEADVICTATSVEVGCGPVFSDDVPRPWAHFNAVGSDFPGKIELPVTLLRQAFVCPDFRTQAVLEGECQQLSPEQIGPELWELVQDPDQCEAFRSSISVFDSTGWALEDYAALRLFLDYAEDLGLGTRLQVEAIPSDPRDPYQLVHPYALMDIANGDRSDIANGNRSDIANGDRSWKS